MEQPVAVKIDFRSPEGQRSALITGGSYTCHGPV